jgi:nitric oxide reductase NorD protein
VASVPAAVSPSAGDRPAPRLRAMPVALAAWLRLVWNRAPPLQFGAEVPHLAAGALHLPAEAGWTRTAAAAAHATAHLVHSPPRFDGTGLGAVARALVGLLEDARVEALAVRELPGLARLWRPLHTATPSLGSDLESLLQRLARSLADPAYDDPDPWVRKGRALVLLDAGLGICALRTPADVRTAALRLGNDIGQMRLPFNSATHRPMPDYRDDHRWMWAADTATETPPPAGRADGLRSDDDPPSLPMDETVEHHPEWDRLIGRLRPAWCRVVERAPVAVAVDADADRAPATTAPSDVLASLRGIAREARPAGRSETGDRFDPDALVEWRVSRRLGAAGDLRVYRGRDELPTNACVWLLVDRSASADDAMPSGTGNVLGTAADTAAALASALHGMGAACTVAAFNSHGRHHVRLQMLKLASDPVDAAFAARLRALRPGGSTRLGAVLRHATHRLGTAERQTRWILVLSDGEPHDTDVHDRRYLVDDAAQAVRAAARAGVCIACLSPGRSRVSAHDIFGRRRTAAFRDVRAIGASLRQVLGRA